jgi:putative ABC transport system permease protein
MISSVNARTSEIGVRRALGALPSDISRQFLIETTLSLGFGGVLGILLGGLGTELIAVHMKLDSGISWFGVVVGLAASAATGLLAGVLPARRAAQLQPVDALK